MKLKIFKKVSWQIKLIILVIILGAFPSILISYKVVNFVKEEFKSSINSQLIFLTNDIISTIDNTIKKNLETAFIIQKSIENSSLTLDQKIYFISTFIKESEDLISVELFVKNGKYYETIFSSYKDNRNIKIDFSDEFFNTKNFKEVLNESNIYISTPKYNRQFQIWTNFIIIPLNFQNSKEFYIIIQTNLDKVVKKLENNLINKVGKAIVLDIKKEIFLSNEFTGNINNKIIEDATSQLFQKNNIGLINNYDFGNNKKFVVAFGYPKEVKWVVVGIIDENSAYATVNDFIIFIGFFISITTMLMLIISFTFSKLEISKPIEKLSLGAKKIAEGNFNLPIEYTAKDSIGLLNSSLSQMANQLQKYIQEIEQQKEQLQDYSKNLELKVEERTRELYEANNELKKAYQRVLELNEEKNEFLGIAAHDLKNPLTAVSAFADILKNDTEISKEQHDDFLTEIIKASERMFFIVKNLLDVNAIEQGKLNTNIKPILLLPIIEDIINQFKESLSNKNITLIKSFELSEPKIIADNNLTYQIIQNILSNAIKFSQPKKSITITVRNSSYSNMIDISIKDEGPGFTEEDKKKLFKKFARLSARPTAGEHSTGLGLSIVKKLVEMMDGKITLNSEPGKGAEFIISFLSQNNNEQM
ncbi:MAG: ATP-binding protein [Melioribacteraceae bacterium]|nr:ATP-binding protein [Melioribacteraceae bacterium]